MSYYKFINKKERLKNKSLLWYKTNQYKNIKKNDFISVGYHEYDKEEINLELYKGACTDIKGIGVNKKIKMFSSLQGTEVRLNFFMYNPYVFDFKKI